MLGYVVGFDELTLYHAGDTRWFHELAGYLTRHDIDVAILPINGYRPERRVAGNMWGEEAARLARDIGADLAIPCHYNMFTFNTEPPDEFIDACDSLDQSYIVLECGQRIRVPPKASPQ
jgi:L-ascorbate metabolism protein UlaG (beta-lactamase superfamily)